MEEASSAGVEREKRRLSVVGTWRGIAYSKNALSVYCLQRLAFNRAMRRHHIETGIGR